MEIHEKYKKGGNRVEYIDDIKVIRSWIYVSKSKSIISRLLNYFSFVWSSYWRGRKLGNYDYILVESPPLFLGYSAIALSRKLNAKLIFNVSDLWPESAEKLGIVTNKRLLRLAYKLEKKCYLNASIITGQTQGIVDDIKARFSQKKVFWLPNGVDLSFYNPVKVSRSDFRQNKGFKTDDLIFFYGGILGHAQGLELILETANALKKYEDLHFVIQGSGPEKEKLIDLKKRYELKNIHFFEPVGKDKMPEVLSAIDIAMVPLKKLDLFKGAIPSKIFEALAMEKPLLLGVEGEAKHHFIDKAQAGLFYIPEDIENLKEQMIYFRNNREEIKMMGKRGRKYVSDFFNRNKIAEDLYNQLQNM